ncbi:hypothetical protein M3226_19130 [Neobacillus cucumis]|nr:hypothetical protein [Neobacillus cucumis]MCM3727777.1 hypothetical protein [Neobacillus cucumis]
MVFLCVLLAILLVGIIGFFIVKKSKVKQEEFQNADTSEALPKFRFDD